MVPGDHGSHPLGVRRHAQVASEPGKDTVTIHPLPTGEDIAVEVAHKRSTVMSVNITMAVVHSAA